LEARAYGLARHLQPLLVNTVVGFIGPEYLYDGKQIVRAGLEDHFCGKLLGLPMGVDVCYTNHAEADGDDTDSLLTLLGVAGCTYVITVPGADDVMLGYQSTSFHDALYVRDALGLRPAPEFETWLRSLAMIDDDGRVLPAARRPYWRSAGEHDPSSGTSCGVRPARGSAWVDRATACPPPLSSSSAPRMQRRGMRCTTRSTSQTSSRA
jgi:ethanolamine ammonia-lyase large subunit